MNDSEEQMQVEDAIWEAAHARHRDKFASLTVAAQAEIDAGTTEPLFTENGELKLPCSKLITGYTKLSFSP